MINDLPSTYIFNEFGKKIRCPIYVCWKDMIRRTSKDEKIKHYEEATLEEEWLLRSNFHRWCVARDYKNMQLDKDILIPGNNHYSPETCIFVPKIVNCNFKPHSSTNNLPGVRSKVLKSGQIKYEAFSRAFGKRDSMYLGFFESQMEAHFAWQRHKIFTLKEISLYLKSIDFKDVRIFPALESRISKIQLDIEMTEPTLYY